MPKTIALGILYFYNVLCYCLLCFCYILPTFPPWRPRFTRQKLHILNTSRYIIRMDEARNSIAIDPSGVAHGVAKGGGVRKICRRYFRQPLKAIIGAISFKFNRSIPLYGHWCIAGSFKQNLQNFPLAGPKVKPISNFKVP